MANKDVCEVYIEQQIEEGLREGKKPYSIGKELSAWVERLFEAKIPATTIEKRAERTRGQEFPTNVGNDTTNESQSENECIQDSGSWTREDVKPEHGGSRRGAGRPRGSDKDWRMLYETIQTVKELVSEIGKLRVDQQHKIPARDLCNEMSNRFEKLAHKLSQ